MLTILIPLAGEGRRFREAGYNMPKPFIDVNSKPMIERVIDNIDPKTNARWVFALRDSGFAPYLWGKKPGCFVVECGNTEGAACTCLLARHRCPDDEPLLIANCDQLIEPNKMAFPVGNEDAAIVTMEGDGTNKWSYVEVMSGDVMHVVEKQPISDRATCGIYWFRKAKYFFDAVDEMIAVNDRTNGEFYVAPAFNYIDRQVKEIPIEDFGGVFYGLGTPEDLKMYLSLEPSK